MPTTATRDDWRTARLALLEREKALTKLGDEIAAARRALPWVKLETNYTFDTPDGPRTLRDLFHGRSQLLVYHFMFDPNWDAGCPSCSFWADGFNGVPPHLAHRDTTLVAVSRAPLAKLQAYQQKMGWSFPWVSSAPSRFNLDFNVSFEPDVDNEYNFRMRRDTGEAPGLSAFALGEDGAVYHTYSTYARGLEYFNPAYKLLDLTAKGRDEDALEWPMAWLRRRYEYTD